MTYWFGLEPAEDLTDAWVGDAVDRAFDGPAWLRPRFPGGREVILSPRPSPSGTVAVTSIRRVGGSRKRLTADLHVPGPHRHHRFALLRAAVLGLAAVGAEFGLGPCPLRRPGRGVRAPLIPGTPRPAPEAEPGRLLLVAGDPVDAEWHEAVAARLGATRTSEATWISTWTR
nr:hypothetical protein GCM10020063_075810 [Dactylosporangium thailandense]